VHLDIIKVCLFTNCLPTDAQLNCLKKQFKFTLKLMLKELQNVSV